MRKVQRQATYGAALNRRQDQLYLHNTVGAVPFYSVGIAGSHYKWTRFLPTITVTTLRVHPQ